MRSVRLAPHSNYTETVGNNIELNRDLLLDAIRSGQTDSVEELLGQSLAILRSFLSATDKYGLHFDYDTAKKEDGFFSDWRLITDVERHFIRLIEPALHGDDREVVAQIVAFPLKVMNLALDYGDHLLFQRFAKMYPYLYTFARREMSTPNHRDFVIDRCWRLLIELDRLTIMRRLQAVEIAQDEVKTLGDYSKFLVVIFSQLLKLALDYRDLEQFKGFASAVRQLADWLGVEPHDQIVMLESRLYLTQDSAVQNRAQVRYCQDTTC